MMVARATGYKEGVFTHFVANEQIYDRHIDNAHELLKRAEARKGINDNPQLILKAESGCDISKITIDDFEMKDYNPIKEPKLIFELGI